MSEERIYEETVMSETSIGETPISEQNTEEMPVQEPVKAKKGFATASLVFGILAFITTLFLVNYVFGIISLIFGIVYLVKKADVKPKGKAITGVVLASLSLIISTTIWVGGFVYFTQTNVTDIIDDAVGLLKNEAISGKIEELTGGAINKEMLEQLGSGEELVNNMISDMTGGAIDLKTVEQFVGGEVSIERVVGFVGDVKEEEITAFVNELGTLDEAAIQQITTDFEGEVTYKKLEEKFGKDFSLREIMDYVRNAGK